MRARSAFGVITTLIFACLTALSVAGCQTTPRFSEEAYSEATALKVDSLQLMDSAVKPYAEHAPEVEALRTKIEKAYEYAAGRPNNQITTQQWSILKDPNRNLLGGFLKRWQDTGTLSKAFVDEAKKIVSDAFDTIIGLESGKIKPGEVKP
jgi:hypothetical protein